jgi:hypothetical protein
MLDFEFHRSVYLPPNPPGGPGSPAVGTEFVVPIGKTGGNFINWTSAGTILKLLNGTPEGQTQIYDQVEAAVWGDDPNPSNFAIYPHPPDSASVEVWLRGYFGGSGWTQITRVRLYATALDLDGYGSGAFLNGQVKVQYPTGDTTLVGGLNELNLAGPHFQRPSGGSETPTVSPMQQSPVNSSQGYLDLTPGEGATPSQPYSKYAVLQLATGSDPTPGEGGRSEFTLVYDES